VKVTGQDLKSAGQSPLLQLTFIGLEIVDVNQHAFVLNHEPGNVVGMFPEKCFKVSDSSIARISFA